MQEDGDFELDGVTFPSAEIKLEFVDPSDGEGSMFPTGKLTESLDVPGVGTFEVTMISAGIPTVFLRAADLGYEGTELQEAINNDEKSLARFESIRAQAAPRMGMINRIEEAEDRQHTPKVAFVAPPKSYLASSGKRWMRHKSICWSARFHGQVASRHDGNCGGGNRYCGGNSWHTGQ